MVCLDLREALNEVVPRAGTINNASRIDSVNANDTASTLSTHRLCCRGHLVCIWILCFDSVVRFRLLPSLLSFSEFRFQKSNNLDHHDFPGMDASS